MDESKYSTISISHEIKPIIRATTDIALAWKLSIAGTWDIIWFSSLYAVQQPHYILHSGRPEDYIYSNQSAGGGWTMRQRPALYNHH